MMTLRGVAICACYAMISWFGVEESEGCVMGVNAPLGMVLG